MMVDQQTELLVAYPQVQLPVTLEFTLTIFNLKLNFATVTICASQCLVGTFRSESNSRRPRVIMASMKLLTMMMAALLAVSAACDDQTCTLDSSNTGCYSPTTNCQSYSFTYTFTFDYSSYPNPSTDFGITVKILSTDSDSFTVTFPNPICPSGSDDRYYLQ